MGIGAVYVAWVIAAGVMLAIACGIGGLRKKSCWYGIFLDANNKVSLSQFQTVIWTILVLSLSAAVALVRFAAQATTFVQIPDQLLAAMGITYGSSVLAFAIKASKGSQGSNVRPSGTGNLRQLWALDEGGQQDEATDVSKFQNFLLSMTVCIVYIVKVISVFNLTQNAKELQLPIIEDSWLVLLGISYGTYLAGKIPNTASVKMSRTGDPANAAKNQSSVSRDDDPSSIEAIALDQLGGLKKSASQRHRR